jgi:hypothetical protein
VTDYGHDLMFGTLLEPPSAPGHDVVELAELTRLLRLVGRLADGWIPSSPHLRPDHLPAANQIIDQAAITAGIHCHRA